ncbi:hypothetical protein GCM10011607_28430 [Shewanella inventionis]|uniref:Type IV secretion protein DotH n=1 Tax=Shewanella inventionis TaxID=1738770 RepID=A0ABQ1JFN6_9GAMM|nr:DotH/IcmK family type IV secretion protein [Shewanella inventionis]GGB66044.1 hypothetical protein GCM10011607_28430 [Shewanella inventionis]
MNVSLKSLPLLLALFASSVFAENEIQSPTSDVVLPAEVSVQPVPSAQGVTKQNMKQKPGQIRPEAVSVNGGINGAATARLPNPVQIGSEVVSVNAGLNGTTSPTYPTADFKEEDPSIHQEALLGLFAGMTPEQIKQVKLMSEMLLEAKSSQVTPLTPSQDVFVMNLSPGGAPPTIRTREGFNTVISFLDTLGKPWPIEWSLPGNSAYEEIDSQGDKPVTHTIVLNAKSKYETTNYTVKLVGLDDPLMFILVNTIHGTTDFKITYKIPKIGPNTEYENTSSASGIVGTSTNSILDINMDELDQFFANPPAKANVIPVSLPQIASVWYYNSYFIVKTRHELAEDYERITYGPNGWKVYAVRKIDYEMVVVTEDGMVQVALPAELVHNYSTMDSKS